MALIKEELSVVNIESLLKKSLNIPEYQRPYVWSVTSASILFNDIYAEYKKYKNKKLKNELEYRIGTVILHKDNKENYNIVDGQQRIITISILLYCLGYKENNILKKEFQKNQIKAIIDNHEILKNKVKNIVEHEKVIVEDFKKFIFNNCTVVKIVTDKEQEAFQFFDSQNSRGKSLKPHDLLKAYHLREMMKEELSEDEKKELEELINKWENIDETKIEILFYSYLFPLINWYNGNNGLGYDVSKINMFKGIPQSMIAVKYNYAKYHESANKNIEPKTENNYQLTQPIIAGKEFFCYIKYYLDLLDKIEEKNNKFIMPNYKYGDKYVKQLFENVLLFFADRFGIDEINESIMNKLYKWSYSIRMVMKSVYIETINNYARGNHERINYGKNIFEFINGMLSPKEIDDFLIEEIENLNQNSKYESVLNKNIENYIEIWDKIKGADTNGV